VKKIIDYAFNWRKNPSSVLLIAIPLFVIGMATATALAIAHIMKEGDWGYMYILITVVLLAAPHLIIQLVKLYKLLRRTNANKIN
jgi:hypothetical protein